MATVTLHEVPLEVSDELNGILDYIEELKASLEHYKHSVSARDNVIEKLRNDIQSISENK